MRVGKDIAVYLLARPFLRSTSSTDDINIIAGHATFADDVNTTSPGSQFVKYPRQRHEEKGLLTVEFTDDVTRIFTRTMHSLSDALILIAMHSA